MATAAERERRVGGRARSTLRARLEERREEIEAAALTRVRAISDPAEVSDPAYAEGLRAAVAAAVAYGIETTGRELADSPIPVALLAQARMAARVGIPLGTVLRRYFAGYSLLGYFILEEATHAGLTDGDELKRLLGAHAGLFDRLLAAVGEEHTRETESARAGSTEQRRLEAAKRLLDGELVDTSWLGYDFDAHHLGVVTQGLDGVAALRDLASSLDWALLTIQPGEGTVWAWLGARESMPVDFVDRIAAAGWPADRPLAVGEPGKDVAGWRLSHRQAVAALPVAVHQAGVVTRYSDVALLASVAQDALLKASLREIYLRPLEAERDGGRVARETLRAYLAHECNVSSAAAALGVNRHTVRSRLRAIEERIGRPLGDCAVEITAALRLAAIDHRD